MCFMGDDRSQICIMRKRAGLSQDELASRTGTSRIHLGRIERGEVEPRIGMAQRIALALGTSVRELWPVDEIELDKVA